jgi:hypothetical protein
LHVIIIIMKNNRRWCVPSISHRQGQEIYLLNVAHTDYFWGVLSTVLNAVRVVDKTVCQGVKLGETKLIIG